METAGFQETVQQIFDAFRDGLNLSLRGLAEMQGLIPQLDARLAAEASRWSTTLGLSLAAVLFAGLIGVLLRMAALRLFTPRAAASRNQVYARLKQAGFVLFANILGLIAFALSAHFLLSLWFAESPVAFVVAITPIRWATTALGYLAAARFLFSEDETCRLVPIANAGWHRGMLVAYGAIGGLVGESVRLAHATGGDPDAIEGWFFVGATALTLLKLWWFIRGAHDIRAAFAGPEPGLVRRTVATILPGFYVFSALAIWFVSALAAGTPQSAHLSFAAGTTQVILLLLPILALGVYTLGQHSLAHREHGPVATAAAAAGLTVLTGAVWLAGIFINFQLWQPLLTGEAGAAVLRASVVVQRALMAAVVCWAVWTFLTTYFHAVAPAPRAHLPGDDDIESTPVSRLHTVLPLVRNALFTAVTVVSILVVLSSLGVDTGPLLAGFGIFGLAISFGSQALIKDIVSGIFFLADDAFRVGEYVDTGGLKGTVEKITVRSLQLRHHNGPLHTIPFGQLNSITNFSRDWGTIKFQLRVDREVDPEKLRKVIKKVGLAMLDDEEFGKDFLVPLKMQGIEDVTDTSLVVRIKFTVRAGSNPSRIRRTAIRQLLAAFRANEIALSSNVVAVRGGEPSAAAAAALSSAAQAAEARAAP